MSALAIAKTALRNIAENKIRYSMRLYASNVLETLKLVENKVEPATDEERIAQARKLVADTGGLVLGKSHPTADER